MGQAAFNFRPRVDRMVPLALDGAAWTVWAESWVREFVAATGSVRQSDLAAACEAFDRRPPHPSHRSALFARLKAAGVLAPDTGPELASANPASNARRERAYVRGGKWGA